MDECPEPGCWDPGFFILFSSPTEVHNILMTVGGNAPSVGPRTTLIPQASTAANGAIDQSFNAFCNFLDSLAVQAGMGRANLTENWPGTREPGLYHQIPQHIADQFEVNLSAYDWPNDATAGKLYRVSPTGRGQITFVHKSVGPFK